MSDITVTSFSQVHMKRHQFHNYLYSIQEKIAEQMTRGLPMHFESSLVRERERARKRERERETDTGQTEGFSEDAVHQIPVYGAFT